MGKNAFLRAAAQYWGGPFVIMFLFISLVILIPDTYFEQKIGPYFTVVLGILIIYPGIIGWYRKRHEEVLPGHWEGIFKFLYYGFMMLAFTMPVFLRYLLGG